MESTVFHFTCFGSCRCFLRLCCSNLCLLDDSRRKDDFIAAFLFLRYIPYFWNWNLVHNFWLQAYNASLDSCRCCWSNFCKKVKTKCFYKQCTLTSHLPSTQIDLKSALQSSILIVNELFCSSPSKRYH